MSAVDAQAITVLDAMARYPQAGLAKRTVKADAWFGIRGPVTGKSGQLG